MQFYYNVAMWAVLAGAVIALVEAVVLLIVFRDDVWGETLSNRIVLGLDIITGLGFILSSIFFFGELSSFVMVGSFVASAFLIVMTVSHLGRLYQYLFKPGPKFIKNNAMLAMNVLKIVLLLGGTLAGARVVYPL
ncbi:MAG: hypothetical protein ACFFAZ_01410 [Promethearchaeota archaeon]